MSISEALGERRQVEVPAGTIEYRERGSGPAIVFVHGIVVNGDIWRAVAPELAGSYRCIVPDLPLGSHSHPLRDGVDLSLRGLAAILGDFLAALDLTDVTVVANDTGGAISQWLVGHQAERVGRLVLTSCDAFDVFPPRVLAYLRPTARLRPAVWMAAQSMRLKPIQHSPIAFGWATHRPIDPRIMDSYVAPLRTYAGVRRDFAAIARELHPRWTREAAEHLGGFDRPALVAWAADDKFFPRANGRRLAELLPNARFELVPDTRTFIGEDNPAALAVLVRDFLAEPAGERP